MRVELLVLQVRRFDAVPQEEEFDAVVRIECRVREAERVPDAFRVVGLKDDSEVNTGSSTGRVLNPGTILRPLEARSVS
jgi:hypothetical protein